MGHNVLLVHWGQTGAGPRFLYELATAWNRAFPDNVAWSYNEHAEGRETFRSLAVPALPVTTYGRSKTGIILNLPRLVSLAWELRRFCRRHKIRYVVGTMPSVYQSIVIRFALPSDIQYISCIHDAVPHPGEEHLLLRLMTKCELSRADRVVVFSKAVKQQLVDVWNVPPTEIISTVHPAWQKKIADTEAVKTLVAGKPVRIGFFGRLHEYKGLDILIEACRLLTNRGIDLRLVVHGDGPQKTLRNKADDVPGEWHIGWVPDESVSNIVSSYDILALPYREASQSGVIAQALSVGTPCVATPVGGLMEQVEETGMGILSRDTSPSSFADALEAMIGDPDLYARCSANALHSGDTTYSWTRVVKDISPA